MEFRVVPAVSPDPTTPPQFLVLPAIASLPTPVEAGLALLEQMSDFWDGPAEALQERRRRRAGAQDVGGSVSDNPSVGDTEACGSSTTSRPMLTPCTSTRSRSRSWIRSALVLDAEETIVPSAYGGIPHRWESG